MRKLKFVTGGFYHVYNRGVERRTIFSVREDHQRFLKQLHFFNDVSSIGANLSIAVARGVNLIDRSRSKKKRRPLVKIHAFCLMPNHYHLLLEQVSDDGISQMMQRVGTGYTTYFNLKHERTGRLFESAFRAKRVLNDAYLVHLSRYIHLNPLGLKKKGWSGLPVKKVSGGESAVLKYPWSSLPLYMGDENHYPWLVEGQLVREIFKNPADYRKYLFDWNIGDLEGIREFVFSED